MVESLCRSVSKHENPREGGRKWWEEVADPAVTSDFWLMMITKRDIYGTETSDWLKIETCKYMITMTLMNENIFKKDAIIAFVACRTVKVKDIYKGTMYLQSKFSSLHVIIQLIRDSIPYI